MKNRASAAVVALVVALVLFAGAALSLAVSISAGRRYQVDEVEHVHVAYLIGQGTLVYRDVWEGHNPLLWVFLIPWVDESDPVGSFGRARAVAAVFWIGTIIASAWAARLVAGRWAAALTALLLIAHSTFVERGLEVRPDGPLAAAVMAALAVEVSGLPRLRRYLIEALLLSAAFLFTQKAVFFCVAFGLMWLWAAITERRIRLVLVPTLCWAVPVAAMLGLFALMGNLEGYLKANVFDALRHTTHSAAHGGVPFTARLWIGVEGMRNRFFLLLVALALIHALVVLVLATFRRSFPDRRRMAVLIVALGSLVYLWANPFPYPYLHVAVIPPLAVWIGLSAVDLSSRRPKVERSRLNALAGLGIVAVLTSMDSFPRLSYVAQDRNRGQMATLREIHRITAPDETVFDLAGLYLRPDAYPVFVMTSVMLQRYTRGGFPPIVPFLRENAPVAVIANYRTTSLPPSDVAFLRSHFVNLAGSIFVPGGVIDLQPGETIRFEVLRTKPFRFEGEGELAVDGMPFEEGILTRGMHAVTALESGARGRLLMATPQPLPAPGSLPSNLYVGFH